MSSFRIEGGHRLKGEIIPQGAKNEALQILCACLLTPETVTVSNIPDISDVNKLIELLQRHGRADHPGCRKTAMRSRLPTSISSYLQTRRISGIRALPCGDRCMIVGPLLGRFGEAFIPRPGGDKIGRRRLDTHFTGFQNLGAKFTFDKRRYHYHVNARKLRGAYMLLDEASVTGTANIIMAAVLAEGITTIYNAACEPYVQQLCLMLNRMGAKISGIGSNLLTIEGVTSLKGTDHTILPDMIEVGSFIGLAAMTGSDITMQNVGYPHLGIIPESFRRLGIRIEVKNDDDPYPGTGSLRD